MKNFFKSKFGTILVLLATVVLAGIAIFTAYRLYKLRQEAVAPNAPTSQPAAAGNKCPAAEKCPDGKTLRSCTPPDSDGTTQDSVCSKTSHNTDIQSCGGVDYCCNGTNWVKDLTVCNASPEPTTSACSLAFVLSATASPSATPNSCGGTCGSDSNCNSGFTCSGGLCRNPNCTADTDCTCPTTTATATATSSPTNAPTSAPTNAPTGSQASLPQTGTSLPTILGLGAGGALLLISLFLAL